MDSYCDHELNHLLAKTRHYQVFRALQVLCAAIALDECLSRAQALPRSWSGAESRAEPLRLVSPRTFSLPPFLSPCPSLSVFVAI
jgi:hypothetical protein